MKLFLFLLLVLGLAPFYENLNQYHQQQSYICEKVIDGDTVKLRRNGRLLTVRLAYIDTPESLQTSFDGVPVGKMITRYLDKLLTGKVVSAKLLKRDIYGRWLGELYFKEHFINLLLVEKGLSVLYPRAIYSSRKQKRKFLQSFSYAFSQKVGIWKTTGILNPYHYRKMSKK